jgi:ribosomal protein S18 acetylase RimI-like enzyme
MPEPAGATATPAGAPVIRPATKGDEAAVAEICYRTGFMGEDLRGSGRFGDERLFALVFCHYYLWYESANCFVAEVDGEVVGYIIGTGEALAREARFRRRMALRILLRLLAVTSWRHPADLRELLHWLRRDEDEAPPQGYRAHLHINILPGYQRRGLGSGLMSAFVARLKAAGHDRVYLETSNHNLKALEFYRKLGFRELGRRPREFWSGIDDYEEITMGLEFQHRARRRA